jgi:hypothetical protein
VRTGREKRDEGSGKRKVGRGKWGGRSGGVRRLTEERWLRSGGLRRLMETLSTGFIHIENDN